MSLGNLFHHFLNERPNKIAPDLLIGLNIIHIIGGIINFFGSVVENFLIDFKIIDEIILILH